MFELLSLLCLLIGAGLLVILSIIDFKTYLLPNIYVAPFAVTGILFHAVTHFYYLNITDILIGGLAGYGILWIIRFFGNRYYGQDSLGLGDVKLLGAAGLWLGFEGVLFAMTAGAFVGLLHGLIYAIYKKTTTNNGFSLTRLMIPAGPGFAVGIILMAGWMYKGHVMGVFYDWF